MFFLSCAAPETEVFLSCTAPEQRSTTREERTDRGYAQRNSNHANARRRRRSLQTAVNATARETPKPATVEGTTPHDEGARESRATNTSLVLLLLFRFFCLSAVSLTLFFHSNYRNVDTRETRNIDRCFFFRVYGRGHDAPRRRNSLRRERSATEERTGRLRRRFFCRVPRLNKGFSLRA